MRVCNVGNIEIGSGMPKICVPIVEKSRKDIIEYAEKVKSHNPDLVEWRADYFDEVENKEELLETAQELKKVLGEIPLIFTVRTFNEGGNLKVDPDKYLDIIKNVSMSNAADIIDIEISRLSREDKHIVDNIKSGNCKIILSYHNFKHTPGVEAMEKIISNMREYNPDIFKIAVMPLSKSDMITILQLAVDTEEKVERPVVIISMGKLGIASRICGEIFGSSITFASLEKSSAPGQLNIDELRNILETVHKNYL